MRSRIILHCTLAALLVGGGFLGWHVLHTSGTPTTSSSSIVTASKGNVLTTVSASGNVASETEQSLSFPTSGTVTSISVQVGQQVVAGQELAQIDDTATLAAIVTAKAELETAQDSFTAVQDGTASTNSSGSPTGASSAASSASSAAHSSDSSSSVSSASSAGTSSYDQAVANADQSIAAAESKLNSAQSTLSADQASLIAAQQQLNTDQGSGAPSATISADTAKVTSLSAKVNTDQAAVTSATSNLASVTLMANQSTSAAQKAMGSSSTPSTTTSTSTTTTTVPPTSAETDTAYSKVLSAQADLKTALENEADTTLRAPEAGTVATINGTVGQLNGTSTSASSAASSSGSGGSGSSSFGSGASNAASSSSSSSSSSAFMTLVDLNNYEVQVPFTEADSIGVKVGAAATLSVSAISKTFTGEVTNVDLIGTVSNSVVDYDATVTFDPAQDVSEVKPGMTTQVSIVTQTADDVVTLPSADVTTTGTRTTLNVEGSDGKTQSRIVTIGLRGDNTVEIASGLSSGEKVKITRTASTATAATGLGGLGGGLGGGGLGGGGFGGGGAFRRAAAGGGGGGGTGGGG